MSCRCKHSVCEETTQRCTPCQPGRSSSAVALEGLAVVAQPGGAHGGTQLVGPMALGAQATVGLSCGCQAAQLTVLVHRVHDPVDTWILQASELNKVLDRGCCLVAGECSLSSVMQTQRDLTLRIALCSGSIKIIS